MTRREARGARTRRGAGHPPLDLIHRSNSPNPALARVCGPFELVRYELEWGVSPAVIEAAFCIAIKLARGGYARST